MDSFTIETARSNPWSSEAPHPADKFLELRSKSEYSSLMTREELQMKHDENDFLKGLDAVKSAEESRKQLAELKQRILELTIINRKSDILRSEELKNKLDIVETLLHSFEKCVTEVQTLQQSLMHPHKGNFMKIEYKYHKSVVELFSNSVKILTRLQTEMDVLDWHKQNQVDGAQLRAALESLTNSVAEMEKGLQVAEKAQSILEEKNASTQRKDL